MKSTSYPFYMSSLFARTKYSTEQDYSILLQKPLCEQFFIVVAMVMNTTNKVTNDNKDDDINYDDDMTAM